MPVPYREPAAVEPEPAPGPDAALARLGPLVSTHVPPPLHRALIGPVLLLGLIVGVGAAVGAPLFILLPFGLAAFAIVAATPLRTRGFVAALHAHGLVLSDRGTARAVAFEDVDEVWFEVDTFQSQSGAHLRALRLRDFDGAVHRIPLQLQGAAALVGAVLRECSAPLLAEARQALREGATLTFAAVQIDRTGITVGGARLGWSEIRLAVLQRGKIYLYRRLPILAWRTVNLERVPNPTVLVGLLAASVARLRVDDQLMVPFATVAEASAAVAATGDEGKALALRSMFVGGAFFLVGLAVTYVTYTQNSRSYVLAWGPIVFGALRFLQGLAAYLARPRDR